MVQSLTRKLPTRMNNASDERGEFAAHCPSCRAWSTFRFVGEQHWPDEVAKLTGLPRTIQLYLCYTCGSTISEQNLNS
jgi:hypothetical protein